MLKVRVSWLALIAGLSIPTYADYLPGTAQVRVEVTRRGDTWTADYQFDRESPVWVFPRSDETREDHQPWRQPTWSVETAGVNVERRGWYDVLVANRGNVPKTVRIRFTPIPKALQNDYAPALVFTDGSVALFVAQFEVFPMDSVSAAKALPSDLNNQVVPDAHIQYVFRDAAGPVLSGGKYASPAETLEPHAYAFFGRTRTIETPDMIGILDPALPEWVRNSITDAVPRLLARYTQELGPPPAGKPTIMLSWSGPTPGLVSRAGSVLPGLIVLTYEGAGVLEEDPEQRIQGLWFIAHEAAHFWLGQTVAYEYARDAWITEGGADLLAMRLIAGVETDYDWHAEFNHSLADCAALTRRRGIERARDRNESRAYYACGAVFGLVAESASGKSFFGFVRHLIQDNRVDGIVTRAEWLAELDAATKKPDLSRDIARLLDRGVPDPEAFLAALLRRAGVDVILDAKGTPQLR